jgi:hypothetical protein
MDTWSTVWWEIFEKIQSSIEGTSKFVAAVSGVAFEPDSSISHLQNFFHVVPYTPKHDLISVLSVFGPLLVFRPCYI